MFITSTPYQEEPCCGEVKTEIEDFCENLDLSNLSNDEIVRLGLPLFKWGLRRLTPAAQRHIDSCYTCYEIYDSMVGLLEELSKIGVLSV